MVEVKRKNKRWFQTPTQSSQRLLWSSSPWAAYSCLLLWLYHGLTKCYLVACVINYVFPSNPLPLPTDPFTVNVHSPYFHTEAKAT
jgi:hypothetical protein